MVMDLSVSRKMNNEIVWRPWNILNGRNDSDSHLNYAVIILNTKIHWEPDFLLPLWNKAKFRVTVDGGTNHWFNWLKTKNIDFTSVPYPHIVTGDMDSIDVKNLEMIRDHHKTTVIVTDDQNETDFTKALREIKTFTAATNVKIEKILTVVDTAGRLDQIMANINTLFKAKEICPGIDIFQLASDSLSWIICNGKHKIYIPEELRKNQTWCALIPVGEECNFVSTSGLKWDIKQRTLKFGDLVSTSNTYSNQSFVTIETEKCLLWSMGLRGIPFLDCDNS